MSLINAVLARAFDALLAPFRQLPPIVGLAIVSLATAIAMLLIFRRTSDQRRLAAVKRQIHAALFEIRLFNDDLRAIFRAQGEILRHNLTYLRLSVVPMLWMIVPLVLGIAQRQVHYGYGGLTPGERLPPGLKPSTATTSHCRSWPVRKRSTNSSTPATNPGAPAWSSAARC